MIIPTDVYLECLVSHSIEMSPYAGAISNPTLRSGAEGCHTAHLRSCCVSVAPNFTHLTSVAANSPLRSLTIRIAAQYVMYTSRTQQPS